MWSQSPQRSFGLQRLGLLTPSFPTRSWLKGSASYYPTGDISCRVALTPEGTMCAGAKSPMMSAPSLPRTGWGPRWDSGSEWTGCEPPDARSPRTSNANARCIRSRSNAKAASVLFLHCGLQALGVRSWPFCEPTTLYGHAARGRLSGLRHREVDRG